MRFATPLHIAIPLDFSRTASSLGDDGLHGWHETCLNTRMKTAPLTPSPSTTNRPSTMPLTLPTELLARGRVLDLARGEPLFRQGDPVREIVFVLEGEMKAVRHLWDGSECVMVRARGGELFAESSLADSHYRCDGLAISASHLALIPVEILREALGGEGSLALDLSLALARQARRQCSRQERLRLKRARDRVLHFLACEGGAEGVVRWSMHLSELANELALERETLYRTLAALETEGIIERGDTHLRLLRQA